MTVVHAAALVQEAVCNACASCVCQGNTALHLAAVNGHTAVVEALLGAGAQKVRDGQAMPGRSHLTRPQPSRVPAAGAASPLLACLSSRVTRGGLSM